MTQLAAAGQSAPRLLTVGLADVPLVWDGSADT